jgi:hypothetical protein
MARMSSWRDRIAALLLILAALGALLAFVTSIGNVTAAEPATKVVQTWRMYGFLVFTGLFVFLAVWPRHYAGVWELVIFHKAAMAVNAAILAGAGAVGAQSVAIIDGVLAIMTITAYVLARGYTAWERLRTP